MPPVVIGAGIAAAGTLGAAALSSRAANRATEASQKANEAALAYSKEQEAIRRQDYERALAQWNAGRASLFERYGVSVPALQQPQARTNSGFRATAPLAPGALVSAGTANVPNATLADIMAEREAMATKPGRWNEWESYGLRSV